jgi:hypothetical protein
VIGSTSGCSAQNGFAIAPTIAPLSINRNSLSP